jgi:zinc protease
MNKFGALAVITLGLSLPAMGQTPQKTSVASPSPATSTDSAALPSADKILTRYVEALGGRAAWQKLNSRISTGTIEVPAMNLSGTVEMHEKAPNSMLAVIVINGAAYRQGFDGSVGWSDDPQNGLRQMDGAELDETRRDSDFYHPLDLKKIYSSLTVTAMEKIRDRDAYVVEAAVPGGGADRLYFDVQSGLVLRIISQHHTPEGVITFTDDLSDYRDVDGVKLPFTVHQSSAESDFTIRFSDVRHNVAQEDAQFSKPAAQ